MSAVLFNLVPIAVAVVAIILAIGIFALFRGGDFNRNWSNRLMRARVVAQAVALLVIMAALWLAGRGPHG